MKPGALLIALFFLGSCAIAQGLTFFRVYNSEGKKVNKGVLFRLSDSSLRLIRKNILVETPLPQIDVVRSNRTTGHRVMMTMVAIASGAIVVAAVVLVYSGQSGPGYISIGRNRSRRKSSSDGWRKIPPPLKEYKVNGDEVKWKEQKKLLGYQLL